MEKKNVTSGSLVKGVIFSIIVLAVSFALSFLGQCLGELILKPLNAVVNDGVKFALVYAMFIGEWIVFLLAGLINKKQRYIYSRLKVRKEKVKVSLLVGFVTGFGLNLLLAVFAVLHGDIKLNFNGFNIGMVLLFIVCVTIQSGAEELSSRWFQLEKVLAYLPSLPVVAILANAICFGMMHAGNSGAGILPVVELGITGILYSLIVYYFESFWGAVIAHSGWNFCQSILLGLPNSGNVSEYSVFKLDTASARNSIFYNTEFGIEGSIVSIIFMILACLAVFWFGRKYKAKHAGRN